MRITHYVRKGFDVLHPAYIDARSWPSRVRNLNSSYVEETWNGIATYPTGNAAVFAHFDSKGEVHEYVFHAVEQLKQAGFSVHFVSSAPRLSGPAIARLVRSCAKVHRRKNVGHDFGAYKDGILSLDRPTTLILLNDSVYGPLVPISELVAKASPEEADVWGACDSWDIRYHLQSFFLVFHKRALMSDAFAQFWEELPYVSYREWVIHRGEVGLTQKLLASGLTCRALFPYECIIEKFKKRTISLIKEGALSRIHGAFVARVLDAIEGGGPLNPTHYFWDLLITDMGFPFVKRDLLQRNPIAVPGLTAWREIVTAKGYDPQIIADHLRLYARNHSV